MTALHRPSVFYQCNRSCLTHSRFPRQGRGGTLLSRATVGFSMSVLQQTVRCRAASATADFRTDSATRLPRAGECVVMRVKRSSGRTSPGVEISCSCPGHFPGASSVSVLLPGFQLSSTCVLSCQQMMGSALLASDAGCLVSISETVARAAGLPIHVRRHEVRLDVLQGEGLLDFAVFFVGDQGLSRRDMAILQVRPAEEASSASSVIGRVVFRVSVRKHRSRLNESRYTPLAEWSSELCGLFFNYALAGSDRSSVESRHTSRRRSAMYSRSGSAPDCTS